MNTSETSTNSQEVASSGPNQPHVEVKLVDIPIKDENTALNVIVSFLSIAQKRGTFTFDESAKIWECIKMFQR